MDNFEKQQTIEAVKMVIKARWFYVLTIVLQGAVIKIWFPSVPLPTSFLIFLVVIIVFLINFGFWVYLRRSPEKINNFTLEVIKFSQVPLEQFGLAAILYFSGTANKMLLMMYIIPIMVGSALYRIKGIILSAFSTMILYSGLVFLEYLGLMPYLSPEAAVQSTGKVLRGEWYLVKGHIIGFNLYIIGASFYAAYLANLFKRREKNLVLQKNDLAQKTQALMIQAEELEKTKNYLHEALVKSDKARADLEQIKSEIEKANSELKIKINELEKYSQVTTGRELKMIELKEEIKNLKETIGNLKSQLVSDK
ncbi:MAG: hypothetical protein A2Y98_01510 [Candidatus Portnoybacteria bacterium RBG_19FT_COMBO_36_7]|uniref:Uncharacterized protein n=1 Tax=Candidatus Portnoybacteria bacterium RBG_19FT_COMBO_36_7 TaxID=1801992 RepID=A0A1G2F745_9BACT|nr:MAG: hypothetical protein A2Y98_01510 [Candidatus Portnoybacteria bacterium RBG_19FT_COMBO_36_7]